METFEIFSYQDIYSKKEIVNSSFLYFNNEFGKTISGVYANSLIPKSGILVLSNLTIADNSEKNQKILFNTIIKLANCYNYRVIMYTTNEFQEELEKFLKKFGFIPVRKFYNRRSGNNCLIWVYSLNKEE